MNDHRAEVCLPADGPWTHAGCRHLDELLDRHHRAEALALARAGLEAAEFEMSFDPDPLASESDPDVERVQIRKRLRCELEIGGRLHEFCVLAAHRSGALPGGMACYSLALVNWRQVGGAWLRRLEETTTDSPINDTPKGGTE
ncbi:MAG: hypothetical protein AAF726_20450 [Planctomycetota bacterium]